MAIAGRYEGAVIIGKLLLLLLAEDAGEASLGRDRHGPVGTKTNREG